MGIILVYLVQRCQTSNQSTRSGLTDWLVWTSSSCSPSQSSHSNRRGLLHSAKQTGLAEPASLGQQPSTTRTHSPSHHSMTSGNGLNSLLRKWWLSLTLFLGASQRWSKSQQEQEIFTCFKSYICINSSLQDIAMPGGDEVNDHVLVWPAV